MNIKDKRISKVKRQLLDIYTLLGEVMEEEDPAVQEWEIAAALKDMVDNLEQIIEELNAAMKHHDKLNKGP